MSNVIEQIQFNKDRRVPIIAINSPDPTTLALDINLAFTGSPILTWDSVTGVTLGEEKVAEDSDARRVTTISGESWAFMENAIDSMPQSTRKDSIKATYQSRGKGSLSNFLDMARSAPEGTIVIIKHSNQLVNFLNSQPTQQAIMNLRDEFAASNRTLILLDNSISMPECLRSDAIVLEDGLPDREEITAQITSIASNAGIEIDSNLGPVIDAVAGLPKFQTDQALALSLTRNGYDLPTLWREKKKLVDQTRGLSVHYEGHGFDLVGGLDGIKDYFHRLFSGPKSPQLIVWIDEIEKSGIAHTNDTNGINADALGMMLSHIEDHNSYCVSLTGLPGTGKSLIAKTMGPQFGRMVVRMDLGAMKGSYVGESESNLRAALRLITSLSSDNALFIATSNSVNALDTALRSRFVDTFYFPLPTSDELAPVWDIHRSKYNLEGDIPEDTGWVARNIKQCCEKAYRLNMTLEEAAETVIPTGVAMAREVERLNEQAHGRYLSASTGLKFEYMGVFNEE